MASILIVDDDPQARTLLNAILGRGLGCELFFAADGVAALELYARNEPDLVVTDLVMPGLQGVAAIEHLTKLYPSARIIAISGKGPAELQSAKVAGAIAVLPKPIDREELTEAVRRELQPRLWGERLRQDGERHGIS